ncbi:helix-turn-helix transcriptional regulator [Actinoallomurus spadix]|uniref:Helix-turn-helix transcriptional regulator n=1 Tax=Actinoallomurus spadix TaxID=79912 RepID=A0ABN0W6T3_9ACTN|nr:helix-turn-helix transcriptional regulator [Actinoallomurus spadix]MCO5986299.1 helix-turn-helix transcriptional regulator [Actinoallomurus spadix]
MRTVTSVAVGDGFALERLRIRAESPDWSDPEVPARHRLVLVRRGAFRARVGGRVMFADPALAYLGAPGEEQSIAHRPGREDVCTVVLVSASLMAEITEERPARPSVFVSGALAVAHRLLAARAAGCADPFEVTEMTIRVVGELCRLAAETGDRTVTGARPGTAIARRELVESARELLAQDPCAVGLRRIARHAGCSPYHLSRVFHRETGMTLTRYRNRVRALSALDAIEAGERDLAGLAARLGFADHAHLTRTVREECGHSPRELRALFAAAK